MDPFTNFYFFFRSLYSVPPHFNLQQPGRNIQTIDGIVEDRVYFSRDLGNLVDLGVGVNRYLLLDLGRESDPEGETRSCGIGEREGNAE
jgi:hypothetical protein